MGRRREYIYKWPMAPRISKPVDGILTPDRRYIVVRGRLWRAANPALPEAQQRQWTTSLMAARREIARGRRAGDAAAVLRARSEVERAKRALGERGPVWWSDGAPDYNRRLVDNTPYLEWYERADRFADAIMNLVQARVEPGTICPSEAARAVEPRAWRKYMDDVRDVGRHLARRTFIVITQRGRELDPAQPLRGPIRFSRSPDGR